MKTLFFTGISFLLSGCNSLFENEYIKNSIPGTYIRFSQHEFGSEYDTLIIIPQNKNSSQFKIIRKWKYERILDGKTIEPEYKKNTTAGVFDEKNRMLKEPSTGISYSFDKKKNLLFAGSTKYQKIK